MRHAVRHHRSVFGGPFLIVAGFTFLIAMAACAGDAGPAGLEGPAGSEGAPGPAGAAGSAGSGGPAGSAGPEGAEGAAGSAGSAGSAGPAGLAGALGDAGPAGSAGPEGAAGSEGPAGPAGLEGAVGSAGPEGPVGPRGSRGSRGSDGADGATGADGAAGDANALTGPTLASAVTLSSLTSLGPQAEDLDLGGFDIDNAGFLILDAATAPAATEVYLVHDNVGDLTLNALTGKGVIFAINNVDQAVIDAAGIDLITGTAYEINGTDVLDATTLGSGVTASSLTSLGPQAEDLDLGNTFSPINVADVEFFDAEGNVTLDAADVGSAITVTLPATATTLAGLAVAQTFTAVQIIGGTTPTLTIGVAGAVDTILQFDGNAVDFFIGIDDTDDKLHMGDAIPVANGWTLTTAGALSNVGTATLVLADGSDLVVSANANASPFVAVSGDTMSGDLDFGNTLSPINVADVEFFDAEGNVTLDAADVGSAITVTLPATATTLAGLAVAQTFTAVQIIGGTTPTLTIGVAGAVDTTLQFDGNAVDFFIGIDDTDDKLHIGDAIPVANGWTLTTAGALSNVGTATLVLADGSDLVVSANANASPFVAVSGDTMSGALDMGTNAITNAGAGTFTSLDAGSGAITTTGAGTFANLVLTTTGGIDVNDGTLTDVGTLNFKPAVVMTVTTTDGAKTQSYHTLGTSLATISGGTVGDVLILRSTGTPTITDAGTVAVNEIELSVGANFVMAAGDTLTLIFIEDGTTDHWLELARTVQG